MKNAHPQFPGYSTSLLETEETPEERERALMPLNTQMELANWNTTLLSCATKVKKVLKEKLPARTDSSVGRHIIRNILYSSICPVW
jgi:hypothetical protein